MMKLLLDTHTLIWWFSEPLRLKNQVISMLQQAENMVFVSAATMWEIAIKKKLGRLDIDTGELLSAMQINNFTDLPITIVHSLYAGSLPLHHDDPFDRMLVAQAVLDDMLLITHDKRLKNYDASVFLF
jgi:PIN domain nuclease of toxin-antitoxin system